MVSPRELSIPLTLWGEIRHRPADWTRPLVLLSFNSLLSFRFCVGVFVGSASSLPSARGQNPLSFTSVLMTSPGDLCVSRATDSLNFDRAGNPDYSDCVGLSTEAERGRPELDCGEGLELLVATSS